MKHIIYSLRFITGGALHIEKSIDQGGISFSLVYEAVVPTHYCHMITNYRTFSRTYDMLVEVTETYREIDRLRYNRYIDDLNRMKKDAR